VENILSRHRNVTILVAVLFAEVIGLGVQVKRNSDTESTRLIRVWTVGAVTALEKAFVATTGGVKAVWHNYFYLRGVRGENRDLQRQIQQLQLQQVRMREDATQARRLQLLLGFKEQFISRTVPAQVIGSSGTDLSRSIYIDKGSSDGIQPDMAVITSAGVVGKVLKVFSGSSQVLLINDPSSGVGAILQNSRLQGVVKGSPAGETMLEKVMSDEQVQPGEPVLTSGGDRIFPKGLPVGTVMKVKTGSELFLNIRLKPAADLGRLEEVLVITRLDERQPTAEETRAPVRAIDILAARLPSVPEKAAEPAANAAAKPAANAGGTNAKPAAKGAAAALAAGTKPTMPLTGAGTVGSKAGTAVPGAQKAAAPASAKAKTVIPAKATGDGGTPAPKKITDLNLEPGATRKTATSTEDSATPVETAPPSTRKPPSARAKLPVAENSPSSPPAEGAPPQP
jgi:rod shape-determining protein MreC